MARHLMQHGVGQLEEMFAKGKADAKVLKQLENELQYRQVPRAIALLAEVQAAMYGGTHAAPQATNVPSPPAAQPLTSTPVSQPDLWERPATSPAVAPPKVVRTVVSAAEPAKPPPVTEAPSASAPSPGPARPRPPTQPEDPRPSS